jgi:PIN domain nuclease of toxin-antitoxin system
MNLLLDTHFLLWVVLGVPRLEEFDWLDRYRPWGVSPVSFLEVALLSELGRLEVDRGKFREAVGRDPRFVVDEAPLAALISHAVEMDWTRDPFDRLLAAHSRSRRIPLCTLDRRIREHHPWIPAELGPAE